MSHWLIEGSPVASIPVLLCQIWSTQNLLCSSKINRHTHTRIQMVNRNVSHAWCIEVERSFFPSILFIYLQKKKLWTQNDSHLSLASSNEAYGRHNKSEEAYGGSVFGLAVATHNRWTTFCLYEKKPTVFLFVAFIAIIYVFIFVLITPTSHFSEKLSGADRALTALTRLGNSNTRSMGRRSQCVV